MNIKHGIYLGDERASIAKIEGGNAVVLKSDVLKEFIPICVHINTKGQISTGDSAFTAYRIEKARSLVLQNDSQNAFIGFTRTLGTNILYYSSNLKKSFSSSELVVEILKTLISFEKSEIVDSAVITVPSSFRHNQIEDLRNAGRLAGLKQVEILREPIAAAMAYGLDSKIKNGFYLVYDFGGGTFDAALLKVEDGIMQVKDTEGDNYLGGKNLDLAIVDEIILPYLQDNYSIDSILEDDYKKQILRDAMKFYAEETKIKMSFGESYNILSNFGDIPGEDDNGEEFELDITHAWSSGKIEINGVGEVIEVCLIESKRNRFTISLTDNFGKRLICEPSSFEIEHGTRSNHSTLAYNIGTEVKKSDSGKIVFQTFPGLEKNKSIPAVGTYNGIKTTKPLRPGVASDFIKIPIYEGEHGSEGTRAIYNEHVADIIISGADLPALLPENSNINLTVYVDRSEQITVTAYFPYFDYFHEVKVESAIHTIDNSWLANEIQKAKDSIEKLEKDGVSSPQIPKVKTELQEIERKFESNLNDVDVKQEVLTSLRKVLKILDNLSEEFNNNEISVKSLEDLLYDLALDNKIDSNMFQEFYDLLQNSPNEDELKIINKELMHYA